MLYGGGIPYWRDSSMRSRVLSKWCLALVVSTPAERCFVVQVVVGRPALYGVALCRLRTSVGNGIVVNTTNLKGISRIYMEYQPCKYSTQTFPTALARCPIRLSITRIERVVVMGIYGVESTECDCPTLRGEGTRYLNLVKPFYYKPTYPLMATPYLSLHPIRFIYLIYTIFNN